VDVASIVLFLIFGVIRGTLTLILQISGQEIPPCTLAMARSLLATCLSVTVLLSYAIFNTKFRESCGIMKTSFFHKSTFVMGICQNMVPSIVFTYATLFEINSGVAGVLISTQPLFVLLYSKIIFRTGKVSPTEVLGMIIGFLGAVVICMESIKFANLLDKKFIKTLQGYALFLAGVVVWAYSSVFWKPRADKINFVTATVFQNFYGFLLALPLAFAWEFNFPPDGFSKHFDFFAHLSHNGILGLLWLGLMAGVGSAFCNFILIQRIGAIKSSFVTYLVPIVSVTENLIVFNTWQKSRPEFKIILVVGTVLILAGIFISNFVNITNVFRPKVIPLKRHSVVPSDEQSPLIKDNNTSDSSSNNSEQGYESILIFDDYKSLTTLFIDNYY